MKKAFLRILTLKLYALGVASFSCRNHEAVNETERFSEVSLGCEAV